MLAMVPAGERDGLAPRDVLPVRGIAAADVERLASEVMPGETVPNLEAAKTEARLDPAGVPPPPPEALSARHVAREATAATAYISNGDVYGAGIVIGTHFVLTCLHVVEDMKTIEISIANGPAGHAEIVDRDAKLDLAVLRVDVPAPSTPRFASVSDVQTGDLMYAMGAPRKMRYSLSRGIVSYAGRPYDGVYYLQTDLPTNGGSSGGPVLDEQARIIAISSFILRDSQGLSFALPIDYARRRFEQYFAVELDPTPFDVWLQAQAVAEAALP
jgi:serine protease Do